VINLVKRKVTKKNTVKRTVRKTTVRKRKPVVLKRSRTQTGKSNIKSDRKRVAMAPGKRSSKNGNIYYEKRRNRSDMNKRKRL